MRKIKIICVSRNKDTYIKQGTAFFEKKIRRYCDFQIQLVKQADYSSGTMEKWLEKEKKRILKHISPRSFTVICDEKGDLLTSLELSGKFTGWAGRGYSQFNFIIGGPYGLSETLKRKVKFKLSFSPMTISHQLFRLVLMEQIYRSLTIINGEKYHHQ